MGKSTIFGVCTPMRLLITTAHYFSDLPGGPARIACDLAKEFATSGYEVWLIAQGTNEGDPEYQQQEGIHLLRYFIPESRGIEISRHKKHFVEVIRLLKKYLPKPPDVIHGNDYLIYFAVMEHYRGHRRSFYSIHSPMIEELPIAWKGQGWKGYVKCLFGLPIIRRIECCILENSTGLAAESRFTMDLIRENYGGEIADRIRIIPGSVDTHRFRVLEDVNKVRLAMGWPVDRPVLFVLRRLERRMGLENLLCAVDKLHRKGLDFFLVVGGTGSLSGSLLAERDRLGLQNCVSFIGRVPDEKLPLAYASCDASVMPTAQLEGFGIPLLEAMACGKPVFATPVGAIPEIVRPFEPRWIARSADPSDVAELLGAFLTGNLPVHPPEQIREYIEANYSAEIAHDGYSEFLRLPRLRN